MPDSVIFCKSQYEIGEMLRYGVDMLIRFEISNFRLIWESVELSMSQWTETEKRHTALRCSAKAYLVEQ